MNHRTILIASIAFALFPVVATAQTTIPAGTTGSAFSATTAGGSYILDLGDTRTFTGASEAVTFGGATGQGNRIKRSGGIMAIIKCTFRKKAGRSLGCPKPTASANTSSNSKIRASHAASAIAFTTS